MRLIAVVFPLVTLGAAPLDRPASPNVPIPSRLISPTPGCATAKIAQSDRPRTYRKLGELPPADAYQAVYRLGADGCIDPLLVGERLRQR